jgi:hypothetical protein
VFRLNPKDFELVYHDAILLSRGQWDDLLAFNFGKSKQILQETEEGAGTGADKPVSNEEKYANLGIWVERN